MHSFIKMAGCKNEQEFYQKYDSPEAFFKAHPEARKMTDGGGVLDDPNNIIDPGAKSAFYDQSLAYNPAIPAMPGQGGNIQPRQKITGDNIIGPKGQEATTMQGSVAMSDSYAASGYAWNPDPNSTISPMGDNYVPGTGSAMEPEQPQLVEKKQHNRPNFNLGTGLSFNTADMFAGALQAANALVPDTADKFQRPHVSTGYNPHGYGTGYTVTMEDGGSVSPEDKAAWNDFVGYLEKSKVAGKKYLNKGRNRTKELIEKYKELNPNAAISVEKVKDYQKELGVKSDGWIGSRTSTMKFDLIPDEVMTPLATTRLVPISTNSIKKPVVKKYTQQAPETSTPKREDISMRPLSMIEDDLLPVNVVRPMGKRVAVPNVPVTSPRVQYSEPIYDMDYETLYDGAGNAVGYSPVFKGNWSHYKVKQNWDNVPDTYNGLPVSKGQAWEELWKGFVPGSNASSWKKTNMKNGGIVRQYIYDDGGPITEADRAAWENMQSAAYREGYLGDDHSKVPGQEFMRSHGVDPNRLKDYQQDFLNLQSSDPTRIRYKDELSKPDDIYGHRTAKQRYVKYQYENSKFNPQSKQYETYYRSEASTAPKTLDQWDIESGRNSISGIPDLKPVTSVTGGYTSNEMQPGVSRGSKLHQPPNEGFLTREESINKYKQKKASGQENPDNWYMRSGGLVEGQEVELSPEQIAYYTSLGYEFY